MRRRAGAALAAALALCAMPMGICRAQEEGMTINSLTEAERAEGWRLLFDGVSTAGWRGYGEPEMPEGWAAVDGSLTRVGRGGDIVTIEAFANFELTIDWKVEPGGNSGIFYRGVEGMPWLYYSAPEMQVLDDERHPDGRSPLTSAGAVYGLYPAPRGIVHPAGQWNSARIVVSGTHVEHWLNGTQVAAYELGSDDWKGRVAASKFDEWPVYGQAEQGHIGLQDHGNRVEFRNIKLRVLP